MLQVLAAHIHLWDQDVFQGDAEGAAPLIVEQRLFEDIQGKLVINRHQGAADIVGSGVERHRQFDFDAGPGQLVDAGHDPAGGEGGAPGAEFEGAVVLEQFEGVQDVVCKPGW